MRNVKGKYIVTLILFALALLTTLSIYNQQKEKQGLSQTSGTILVPDTPTPGPTAGPATPTPVVELNPADFDQNGCVGLLDFNTWFQAFKTGHARSGTNPDGNFDGEVNLLDFNLWFKAMISLPKDKLCG